MATRATTRTLTELLFDTCDAGLCLVAPDGTILRANSGWLRSTGFTSEQVIGEDILALFPDTRDMALALHARARAGHRVQVPRHAQVVNGRETWWEGSIDPVPMDGGTGLLITTRETTAQSAERGRLAAEVLEHGDGVFVLDSQFRFVLVNETFERTSGLPRQKVLGRVFWDLFPLADSPDSQFSQQYRRAMRDRVVVRFEETYPPRGTWNEITAYPTQSGGIAVFFRDVTERRRAEQALALETDKYRSLFEHSLDAVYLTLQDGTILDANSAACRMHGMSLEEIRRAGRAGVVVKDERHAAALRARSLDGRVRAEMTVRRKDGTTLPVEVESVLLDPARPDSAAFVISRDISERKRAEQEVRESIERSKRTEEELRGAVARYERQVRLFNGIASTTPDFVYVFDLQGRFLYANRRLLDVWGMQLLDAVGKTCRELGYEQWHHDMHMREIAQVIATKAPIKGEVPFTAPLTGISGVYEYIFTPVIGPDGEVEIIAGTTRDVTERKDAEAKLREANSRLVEEDTRKDEFLGMLSHELRNPLAPIRNSIYILRHAEPGSEQARRAQMVIERQTEHLTRLVDDLLDVTRIARGKIELRCEWIDLRDVVRRTAEDFRPILEERGVEFDVNVPHSPVRATADATRLAQVVGNLLHNASKFTRSGDTVTLSLTRAADGAEIGVRDSGSGIEPELLPRIFDAFTQGERTLARSEGGLGLGLALVKGITELHGGTVHAASGGNGRGAEFIVRLPLSDGPSGLRRGAGRVERGEGGRRVLVVDDNEDAAESLAALVVMLGHSVEVAYDGASAVAKARAGKPDIILCDLGLPGMSGYDVAKLLREDGASAQLFAISGYAQAEDVRRAIEAGFDGHVAKPPSIEDIERLLA